MRAISRHGGDLIRKRHGRIEAEAFPKPGCSRGLHLGHPNSL
jgi:hypothetical protein